MKLIRITRAFMSNLKFLRHLRVNSQLADEIFCDSLNIQHVPLLCNKNCSHIMHLHEHCGGNNQQAGLSRFYHVLSLYLRYFEMDPERRVSCSLERQRSQITPQRDLLTIYLFTMRCERERRVSTLTVR